MKSFQSLSEKQQGIILASLSTVAKTYAIAEVPKKSIEQKRHTELIIYAFNAICKVLSVSISERVEMLPIITGIATGTYKI